NTRWISEMFREIGLHHFTRGIAKRGCGVVIQINHFGRNRNPLDRMGQNVLGSMAMKMRAQFFLLSLSIVALPLCAVADSKTHNPTWWDKYQYIANSGPESGGGPSASLNFKGNVDVSNECGPQSETFITLNPAQPRILAAGSNEIFRLPMRGYFSSNGGTSWGGVDLPLPPAQGSNGIDFGSDPTLAFDTRGNVFYGYIVIFFGNGNGVNSTEMAVARSTDGGQTYPTVTFFSSEGGSSHFNDKPMITADTK